DDGVHYELDPVPHQWHPRPGARVASGVPPMGGPGVGGGDGNRVPPPPLVAVPAWRHHDEPVIQVPYRRVIGVGETLAQHVGQPAWVRQLAVRRTPQRGGRERTGRLRHVISSVWNGLVCSTGPRARRSRLPQCAGTCTPSGPVVRLLPLLHGELALFRNCNDDRNDGVTDQWYESVYGRPPRQVPPRRCLRRDVRGGWLAASAYAGAVRRSADAHRRGSGAPGGGQGSQLPGPGRRLFPCRRRVALPARPDPAADPGGRVGAGRGGRRAAGTRT